MQFVFDPLHCFFEELRSYVLIKQSRMALSVFLSQGHRQLMDMSQSQPQDHQQPPEYKSKNGHSIFVMYLTLNLGWFQYTSFAMHEFGYCYAVTNF